MIRKLIDGIKKTGAPIVVGLDPMLKFVPEYIRQEAFSEFGETLEGAAEAVWRYNKGLVDAICELVPAVKPQIAMYEQFGVPGVAAFQKTVNYCKEKGLTRWDIWARYRWGARYAQASGRISQRSTLILAPTE